MAPLYVKAFKAATGRTVTYGEEGWGELTGTGSVQSLTFPHGAWTDRLIEAAQDIKDELQSEFDARVRERIREFKNERVKDLRQEVRDEYAS